jgi:hypothetical protein
MIRIMLGGDHPGQYLRPAETWETVMNFTRYGIVCAAIAISAFGMSAAEENHPAAVHRHLPATPAQSASPYAGMERRTVKALSDEQIAALKEGRGMGLALVAELNGYPGPTHVLELADKLQLSDQQRTRTKALVDAMRAETVPIGERLIAQETALDRLFVEKRATRALLDSATSQIAAAWGELRAAHVRYHLAMLQELSSAQLTRYAELRGYAASRQ